MTPKNKKLRELVIEEATSLKKHATTEELRKLDFSHFYPRSSTSCIYGQMTGYCFSGRANELIMKCAKKVYSATTKHGNDFEHNKLNGTPSSKGIRQDSYFSPIEMFVPKEGNMQNGNNKILIGFLKGQTETLKFV